MADKDKKEKLDQDKLEEKAKKEQKEHHAAIKPDPETMGPDPQENMEGPVSSIIKNIAESGDAEDKEKTEDEIKKEKKDRKEKP
jgi:hypothetical protein